eukprot:TRINITY_DN6517_c0_g1_i2.p1 TRINITY_DN6517_c0_g1~~TRINITY_DN6517_c0_g1_i2.p1  ORF type:complete len:181 (-),score=16.73 TRINITY_DN6517_c0_g1_i2:810-1352(-)
MAERRFYTQGERDALTVENVRSAQSEGTTHQSGTTDTGARINVGGVDTSDPAVSEAIHEVRDKTNGTTWVILGYVPKTNSLRVVEKGTGDWEEMTYELMESRASFCYIRYTVGGFDKFVMLAWAPEALPPNLLSLLPMHADMMHRYFDSIHCVHLRVDARNEDDVETSKIVELLNKSVPK